MKDQKRKLYVGIDIHSREHIAALAPVTVLERQGAQWKRLPALRIRNNINDFMRLDAAIMSYVANAEEAAIAIDHTGGHYAEPIVGFLSRRGYTVYYLESKALKAARERLLDEESKSDRIDSCAAAYMLYLRGQHCLSFGISAITPQLGSRAAVLNSLVLQRCQFNKLVNQVTNRLHQLLLAVFPEGEASYFRQLLDIAPHYPTPRDIISSNNLEKAEKLKQEDRQGLIDLASKSVGIYDDSYRWLIRELSIQRKDAIAKLDVLTSALRSEIKTHPYGQILLSFPYIGEIAAATIIATIKDIERWPDKKKFKKALGVYGILRQSGNNTARSRQGREGSKHGRRALFQVCLACITSRAPDSDFKDYYERQVRRGKIRIKALVSTMGKLAEIVYHCLKSGEKYQYQGKYRMTKPWKTEGGKAQ